MNDDDVIALLRAAGNGGGPGDIGPAMREGARMRRRRRTRQAVGGGAGLAAVVAMGIFVTGINSPSTVVVAPPATSASPAPVGSTRTESLSWPQMEEANVQLLLDALGAGWGPGRTSSYRSVELDVNSPAADGLPEGFTVLAFIRFIQAGLFVGTPCDGCEERQLAGGRTVQVDKPQEERDSLEREHSTSALYHRSDSSRVIVTISALDSRKELTAERSAEAVAFLDGYVDTVAELAASEGVRPRVGEEAKSVETGPTADEVQQRYLQEALGDAWGTKVDSERRITLKSESDLAGELPSSDYQGKATLQVLTAAQFAAACDAKPGVEACNWQKLGDGNKVHWRAWADREAYDDTMTGELATYYPREDGSVVMAMVAVLGRGVSASERDAHRDAIFTWLESLRHQLIGAALDRRVGADVYTTE